MAVDLTLELLADNIGAHRKIARWYFDEWVSSASGVSIEQVEITLAEATNRHSPPLMVLAKEAERIVGAAELKTHEMDIYPDYEFWVGGVYVDVNYRGQGVGQCLVNDILNRAKAIGIQTLYLQTEDLTGGLYTRFGFQPLSIVDYKGYKVRVMFVNLIVD